jgi:hypothetical protein
MCVLAWLEIGLFKIFDKVIRYNINSPFYDKNIIYNLVQIQG